MLGDGEVFLDVSSLALGHSWSEALDRALDSCDVALVLIGPSWLDCRDPSTGARRLDDEGDFVRIEITRSLERGIPVVPITLDDTELPSAADLPGEIEELVDRLMDRQGMPIRQSSFRSDVAALIERLNICHSSEVTDRHQPAGGSTTLRDLLTRFLSTYSQWSFSALRIAKWGASQSGFEQLGTFSKDDIRAELELMEREGIAKTRLSKKGGTLYRLV